MLVLEGPQGKQKSEALRTLAIKDDWFTDRLSHVASKDAVIGDGRRVAGRDRGDGCADEGFIIRQSRHSSPDALDRFRPPYGKHPINLPRQCVFAGTINPVTGGYLKDPTGARRFWPVACHGMIDRDGIERDRDQLWAEAVVRYQGGREVVAGDAGTGSARHRRTGAAFQSGRMARDRRSMAGSAATERRERQRGA